MGPRRFYLSANEDRNSVPGASLLQHKDRITMILACNAGGSHVIPVRYIGAAANLRCFRNGKYDNQRAKYHSQKNAWVDSNGFNNWINWFYNEIKKKSSGSLLLIMDNCGGHESEIQIPGLRIEMLLPRSTAKKQPLDLSLIAHSKIRYRSLLLRITIDGMLVNQSQSRLFRNSFQHGMLGIRDGFLPTVGDAMELYNESWHLTSRNAVIKCWMKSHCLPESHIVRCRSILSDLGVNNATLQDLVSSSNAVHLADDISVVQSLSVPTTPLSQILEAAELTAGTASLMLILNSPAPFDADPA